MGIMRSTRKSGERAPKEPRVTVIESIEIAGPKLQKRGYQARKEAAERARRRQDAARAADAA